MKLQAQELACVRGDRTLFADLHFDLDAGAALYLAGPNGSGKTSLLRILCGLSPPSSGKVLWHGQSIGRLRQEYWGQLCYLGHANALKDDLLAWENLVLAGAISGKSLTRKTACEALERIGLARVAGLPAKLLSQGQRRRVALARLSLASVPFWILDEPFAALDAAAIAVLRDMLGMHLACGGMLVYSSHEEVDLGPHAVKRLGLGQSSGC